MPPAGYLGVPAPLTRKVNHMAQTVREKAKIRQNREGERVTEDDIARQRLGPRGEVGKPDTATMTEDSRLQTPSAIDPGHPS